MGGGSLVQIGKPEFRWWANDLAQQTPCCIYKYQRFPPSSASPYLTKFTCRARYTASAASPSSSVSSTKATSKDGALSVLVSLDEMTSASIAIDKSVSITGSAYDFKGATTSLVSGPLPSSKKVTLVRHGLSSWNAESRIQTADAQREYLELYTAWREDPANFNMNGIYPVRDLWGTAKEAWKEILMTPILCDQH